MCTRSKLQMRKLMRSASLKCCTSDAKQSQNFDSRHRAPVAAHLGAQCVQSQLPLVCAPQQLRPGCRLAAIQITG